MLLGSRISGVEAPPSSTMGYAPCPTTHEFLEARAARPAPRAARAACWSSGGGGDRPLAGEGGDVQSARGGGVDTPAGALPGGDRPLAASRRSMSTRSRRSGKSSWPGLGLRVSGTTTGYAHPTVGNSVGPYQLPVPGRNYPAGSRYLPSGDAGGFIGGVGIELEAVLARHSDLVPLSRWPRWRHDPVRPCEAGPPNHHDDKVDSDQ